MANKRTRKAFRNYFFPEDIWIKHLSALSKHVNIKFLLLQDATGIFYPERVIPTYQFIKKSKSNIDGFRRCFYLFVMKYNSLDGREMSSLPLRNISVGHRDRGMVDVRCAMSCCANSINDESSSLCRFNFFWCFQVFIRSNSFDFNEWIVQYLYCQVICVYRFSFLLSSITNWSMSSSKR